MAVLFSELILEIAEQAALISGIVDILSAYVALVEISCFIVSRISVLNEFSSHSMFSLDDTSSFCDMDTDEVSWGSITEVSWNSITGG